MIFNTSNTVPERERQVFGDPLETIWRNCVFGLCGIRGFYRRTFGVVVTSTKAQRKQWLAEVEATVDRFFPKIDPAASAKTTVRASGESEPGMADPLR